MTSLWEVQGWLYDSLFLLKPHAALVTDVASRLDSGAQVLDAGCGSGRLGLDTAAHVVGVDFSSTMLRTAAAREDDIVQGSLVDGLPFTNDSFDQIACINVIYALGSGYASALSELHRVLRPGGQLFLANPVNDQLTPLIAEHFKTASPREMARSVLNIPRFIAWGINLARRSRYESSQFVFLTEDELKAAVTAAGFTIKSVEPTYAGIDRLVVAGKE
ncbi:MAG: methyltransferase domain-containing protein [Candidatus Saccharibacteria bacterium]|jgi:ubiquinone/menaquinone biosynthesis C-methylase UbiE